jgi:MFS family permease
LFGTIDSVAEVFFARDRSLLDAGNWGYGGLAAAWLIGMVIGAGWIAQKLKEDRLAPSLLMATTGSGAAVAIAAAVPAMALALVMFVVGGIGNGVSSVSIRSLIHHRVPGDLRGRAFAAFFSLAFAGQVVATALGGVLLATLPSSQDVLLIGGFGSIAAGLLCLAWFGAIPSSARASNVVIVPDTEPIERRLVVIRDITPPEDRAEELAGEPVEVLPSVEPSS